MRAIREFIHSLLDCLQQSLQRSEDRLVSAPHPITLRLVELRHSSKRASIVVIWPALPSRAFGARGAFHGHGETGHVRDCGRGNLRCVLAITQAHKRSERTRQEKWLIVCTEKRMESRCSEHIPVFISIASDLCRLQAEVLSKSRFRLDHD